MIKEFGISLSETIKYNQCDSLLMQDICQRNIKIKISQYKIEHVNIIILA